MSENFLKTRLLSPSADAALQALHSFYESFDLGLEAQLHNASSEMLAAIPPLDGQETNMQVMLEELIATIRDEQAAADMRRVYYCRLFGGADRFSTIIPEQGLVHVTITPLDDHHSYYGTLTSEEAVAVDEWLAERDTGYFAFLADPNIDTDAPDPDEDYRNQQEPLDEKQVQAYQQAVTMLAQAMADAMQSFEAQTALVGILGATQQMLTQLATYKASSKTDNRLQTEVKPESRAIRQSAAQLESKIKSQIGNTAIPVTLRQTLQLGLRQLQQIKADKGIKTPRLLAQPRRTALGLKTAMRVTPAAARSIARSTLGRSAQVIKPKRLNLATTDRIFSASAKTTPAARPATPRAASAPTTTITSSSAVAPVSVKAIESNHVVLPVRTPPVMTATDLRQQAVSFASKPVEFAGLPIVIQEQIAKHVQAYVPPAAIQPVAAVTNTITTPVTSSLQTQSPPPVIQAASAHIENILPVANQIAESRTVPAVENQSTPAAELAAKQDVPKTASEPAPPPQDNRPPQATEHAAPEQRQQAATAAAENPEAPETPPAQQPQDQSAQAQSAASAEAVDSNDMLDMLKAGELEATKPCAKTGNFECNCPPKPS